MDDPPSANSSVSAGASGVGRPLSAVSSIEEHDAPSEDDSPGLRVTEALHV
ncbi:hypothetical protein [Labedella phragmitis]|uniref:hypothetical protein n=1 Tax=Labedella phragmitis TaxID=2498849 RepID=UPI0014097284|nr:hypothetical protein [Labedella phragmitis]